MRPSVTAQLSDSTALLPWRVNLTPASAACDVIIAAAAMAAMPAGEAVLVNLGDLVTCGFLPVRFYEHDRHPREAPDRAAADELFLGGPRAARARRPALEMTTRGIVAYSEVDGPSRQPSSDRRGARALPNRHRGARISGTDALTPPPDRAHAM